MSKASRNATATELVSSVHLGRFPKYFVGYCSRRCVVSLRYRVDWLTGFADLAKCVRVWQNGTRGAAKRAPHSPICPEPLTFDQIYNSPLLI